MNTLNYLYINTLFSAVYNCDTYGAGNYNEGGECATTTTTDGTTGQAGGSLVDTGSPYFVPIVAGTLLIVIAVSLFAYKIVRRRQAKSS
jgi:hypothetical protein